MTEILMVAGLFLLRVGLPLLVLIILGTLVDRWQNRNRPESKVQTPVIDLQTYREQQASDERKAA